MPFIPYEQPYQTLKGLTYIQQAIDSNCLNGDGLFNKKCQQWLAKNLCNSKVILAPSGTMALDFSALLLDLQPGDEVIMPSFTFTSTANAVVLRGAIPVFIDITPQTMNMDVKHIEPAITLKTKAIYVVHYAGVACDMHSIQALAQNYNLKIVEDAAQCLFARYQDKPLGTFGDIGTFSFHGTKNVTAGEGGAISINTSSYRQAADLIKDKGTNRQAFLNGVADYYTWYTVGSSYVMSEFCAAYLFAQLEEGEKITSLRRQNWQRYFQELASLEEAGFLKRPQVPAQCYHNAHIFFILLPTPEHVDRIQTALKEQGVQANRHYTPLHKAPAGHRYGRPGSCLKKTEFYAERLLRLPVHTGVTLNTQEKILACIKTVIKEHPVSF